MEEGPNRCYHSSGPGWPAVMKILRAGDTVVVALLVRVGRNFHEGDRVQAAVAKSAQLGRVASR